LCDAERMFGVAVVFDFPVTVEARDKERHENRDRNQLQYWRPAHSVAPAGSRIKNQFEQEATERTEKTEKSAGPNEIAFLRCLRCLLVRQAKLDGSCQLKGTDHGTCSFAM